MTYVVRIDTSGDVVLCEGRDVLATAERGVMDLPAYTGPVPWDESHIVENRHGIDVVSARPHQLAPFPSLHVPTVMCVHEWGRLLRLPVNVKAWAMYGRSPLCGPVWVALDGCVDELPETWIAAVRHPAAKWVHPRAVDAMQEIARIEDLTIPDGALT